MTQEQLAELLGVEARYVQSIEAGRQNFTMRTLVSLASALGCSSVAELFEVPTSREVKRGRPKRRPLG